MSNKILLDTNTYLRLGNVINPLLRIPFGKKKYELHILPDLYQELKRNPRLRTDFSWIYNPEIVTERKKCQFRLSDEQKKKVNLTRDIISQTSVSLQNTSSSIDIKCLSYGYVLKINVVTDDMDMLALAKEFDISTFKTLELLDLMLLNNFINMKATNDIIKYWIYEDDLPKNWQYDYKRLFKNEPPSSI